MSEEKVIIEGDVTQQKPLQGSFRNFIISGHSEWVTLGIDQDLCWPKLGDKVRVTGVVRNGRFLTESWEHIEKAPPAITKQKAKKIIAKALDGRGLKYTKLTAKMVSFQDLARGESIFVKIWGWQPNPAWDELKALARYNGFCIESDGGF